MEGSIAPPRRRARGPATENLVMSQSAGRNRLTPRYAGLALNLVAVAVAVAAWENRPPADEGRRRRRR
jgi:hypothetical protein